MEPVDGGMDHLSAGDDRKVGAAVSRFSPAAGIAISRRWPRNGSSPKRNAAVRTSSAPLSASCLQARDTPIRNHAIRRENDGIGLVPDAPSHTRCGVRYPYAGIRTVRAGMAEFRCRPARRSAQAIETSAKHASPPNRQAASRSGICCGATSSARVSCRETVRSQGKIPGSIREKRAPHSTTMK